MTECACDIAFRCGSTISATSRHYHDITKIMLKVTLNRCFHLYHINVPVQHRLYVYRQKPAERTQCPTLITDSWGFLHASSHRHDNAWYDLC